MSVFLEKVHTAAAAMGKFEPGHAETARIEMGRTFAVQLIDAMRSGDPTPDILILAFYLVGRAEESAGDGLLRGFLRELEDAVKEGLR